MSLWRRIVRSERGATAIEYAILTGLIAAVIIVAVAFLGARTNNNFECTQTAIVTQQDAC